MFWETTITYTTTNDEGKEKSVKMQFVCENQETFGEVETLMHKEFGSEDNFDVAAIKKSKIMEIINNREDTEDLIWLAQLQDVFHTDEGEEKYTQYKVIVFAKTFDAAKARMTEYMKQGFDMTLVSLKLTKFEEVLK